MDWLNDMLHTAHFAYTGRVRIMTEYRDRDSATWYRLGAHETPNSRETCRLLLQREIQQTAPDGSVSTYWEIM